MARAASCLATKDRTQLVRDSVALRHQLAVYKRSVGRPNINDGLALLEHSIAVSTVPMYMVRRRCGEPDRTWKTLLRTHMTETADCDVFVVPTVTKEQANNPTCTALDAHHELKARTGATRKRLVNRSCIIRVSASCARSRRSAWAG